MPTNQPRCLLNSVSQTFFNINTNACMIQSICGIFHMYMYMYILSYLS